MSTDLLVDWLALLPAAAVMLGAVYLPGTVLLVLLRSRPTIALAGGPLLTAAMLGVGGFALGTLGIPYSWIGFLGLVGALWTLGLVLRLLVLRGRGEGAQRQREPWRRALRRPSLLLLGAGLLALATLWVPVGASLDPHLPGPKVDPMYHYNVLNAILETGNISMNSAVDYNYGLRVGHVVYPTVWHALAVLGVPLVGIVPAANAFTHLVVPAVFVISTGVLARVVLRRSTVAVGAALLAAGALPAFPAGMLLVRAFWPNALATAMLPGLLAMIIVYLRRVRWSHVRRRPWLMLLDTLVVGAAALGLGFTHPSVLISALLIVVPLLLATVLRMEGVVRRTQSRRMHRLFVAVLVGVPLAGLVLALLLRRVRSYLLRSGEQSWDGLALKGVSMLVNWPTDVSHLAGVVVALVYLPLLLGGLLLLARHRGLRWIPIAWAVGVALVAGSYFPLPVLSGLSGLWYADTYRLYAVQATILPLAIAALAQWATRRRSPNHEAHGNDEDHENHESQEGRAARRSRTRGVRPGLLRPLVVWGLLGSALLGTAYINSGAAAQVGVASTEQSPLAGEEERALLERIDHELPAGSVVIGDPASGVAYLPLESDLESVFTQVNLRDVDGDGIFLAENLDRIHEDPRVCQLLDYYGIGYFYEDEPFEYNYTDRAEEMPGFYEVDTSRGFTLVDEAGTARLWSIDACGPIEPPEDWWQRHWRREAFVQLLDEDAPSGNPAQPG